MLHYQIKLRRSRLQYFHTVYNTHIGLAGMRSSYSVQVGGLVSSGIIVASIEHRDGSAPFSFHTHSTTKKRTKFYYEHPKNKESTQTDDEFFKEYRRKQVEFRVGEVFKTTELLKQLNQGLKIEDLLGKFKERIFI